MIVGDPQSLVGVTVLSGLRLDSLVRDDGALVTYSATSDLDGLACTVRVAPAVSVAAECDEKIEAAWKRVTRYAAGIGALCAPRAAGVVLIGGERLLAVAHEGTALDTAEDRIVSGSYMSLEQAAEQLAPVAEALTALHDQGLVHGAVHPGAVHLKASGPVLSAFGLSELAVLLGGATAARDVVPPRSRVPELVGIIPAAPAPESDLYALALIATELLAGRPFTAERDLISIARAIDSPMVRPTPSTLSVSLPAHVERVFLAALQTQPNERKTTPRGFLEAILAPIPQKAPASPASDSTDGSLRQPGPLEPSAARQPPPSPSVFGLTSTSANTSPSEGPTWLVYALVVLGIVLLLGGGIAAFVLARKVPASSSAAPVASATPQSPTTATPLLAPDAQASPTAESSAQPLQSPSTSGLSSSVTPSVVHADDLTALVPLDKETPVVGSRDPLVTIVVFVDVQCPYTRKAYFILDSIREQYQEEVRVAVRHRPIPSHAGAERAAEVAATAGALKGPTIFWSVLGVLSAAQEGTSEAEILRLTEEAGVPGPTLRNALRDHLAGRLLDADRAIAHRLMVRRTPTLFINGKRIDGEPTSSQLTALVEEELSAARAALAAGTHRNRLYSTRVLSNVTSGEADPQESSSPPHSP